MKGVQINLFLYAQMPVHNASRCITAVIQYYLKSCTTARVNGGMSDIVNAVDPTYCSDYVLCYVSQQYSCLDVASKNSTFLHSLPDNLGHVF